MGLMGLSANGIFARRETMAMATLADMADRSHRVPLAPAGRRCVKCDKGPLARMNVESICFACQRSERAVLLRRQAAPVSDEEAKRGYCSAVSLRGRRLA